MKQLMRYKITSGRTVEKRDVLMEVSPQRRPRGGRKGRSTIRQVERNEKESVIQLARMLNCNFGGGDLFLTLKYSDRRLPADREAARRDVRNFIARLSRAYKRRTGKKLLWALVTADRSSKTGQPVRLHHHLVLSAMDWAVLAANWPADQFSCRHLDDKGDYTAVARYMVKNAGYGRGEAAWSFARGPEVKHPIYSTPVPVKEAGSARAPKEAVIAEREIHEDSERGFSAAYLRYIMPRKSTVKQGEERRDE